MTPCRYCNQPLHAGSNCDREALKHAIDVLKMEIEAHRSLGDIETVMVTSLVSNRTRKPRVDIQLGKAHTQMDADAAMDVAKNIIDVAGGAYADAFLVHFLTSKIGASMGQVGQILPEFREYREQLRAEFDQLQRESMSHDPLPPEGDQR